MPLKRGKRRGAQASSGLAQKRGKKSDDFFGEDGRGAFHEASDEEKRAHSDEESEEANETAEQKRLRLGNHGYPKLLADEGAKISALRLVVADIVRFTLQQLKLSWRSRSYLG
jgi:hypothetical protein